MEGTRIAVRERRFPGVGMRVRIVGWGVVVL